MGKWKHNSEPSKIVNSSLRATNTCALCGKQILKRKEVTLDHIVPSCRGGSDAPENAQLAHKWCNEYKGIKGMSEITMEEFQCLEKNQELERKKCG